MNVFFKAIELEEVAPEIRAAWEKSHDNCDLERAQHRYNLLRPLLNPSFALFMLGMILSTVGVYLFFPEVYPYCAILLMVGVFVVCCSPFFIVVALLDKPQDILREFDRDVLKLKSIIGNYCNISADADYSAEEALCKLATTTRLAELEHDDGRAAETRKKMADIYNFFATFDLVPPPDDSKHPPLSFYFSSTCLDVQNKVKEMAVAAGLSVIS